MTNKCEVLKTMLHLHSFKIQPAYFIKLNARRGKLDARRARWPTDHISAHMITSAKQKGWMGLWVQLLSC